MSEDSAQYNVTGKIVTMVGHVDTIKKIPSRQVVQVIVELPYEMFKKSVMHFDNENVFIQVVSKEMKDQPFGVYEFDDGAASISEKTINNDESPVEERADKPVSKIGKYCIEAIDFCKDDDFQEFMMRVKGTTEKSEVAAKDELCLRCNIDSRKEFDTNKKAHSLAHDIYREFINYNQGDRKR